MACSGRSASWEKSTSSNQKFMGPFSLLFVFAVWALQVWWSQAWLSRFLFGPAEWLWRVATYRSGQPLRRTT